MQKPEKWLKPWQMGTHLRVLNESYPMNTNMTGLRWFSKTLHPCTLDESSLSIGRVLQAYLTPVVCLLPIGKWEGLQINKELIYTGDRFSTTSVSGCWCLCLLRRFFLLGFWGSFCGFVWWFDSAAFLAALCARVFCATALTCGHSLMMFPTALVRPSRNTMRMSVRRYSGFLMKRKWTWALSPVLRCSWDIRIIVAVWRTLPTWTEIKKSTIKICRLPISHQYQRWTFCPR